MDWTFVYLMLFLKIPIVALFAIVWWAVKSTDEPVVEKDTDGTDEGGSKRPRHPRTPPKGPPRRRGPHGDPGLPAPARSRGRGRVTAVSPRSAPGRERGLRR